MKQNYEEFILDNLIIEKEDQVIKLDIKYENKISQNDLNLSPNSNSKNNKISNHKSILQSKFI